MGGADAGPGGRARRAGSGAVPRCPVRPGDACTLCFPGATGPEDCGLVWQVRQDADLRARLAELRSEHQAAQGTLRAGRGRP